jgi:hypothetical protein
MEILDLKFSGFNLLVNPRCRPRCLVCSVHHSKNGAHSVKYGRACGGFRLKAEHQQQIVDGNLPIGTIGKIVE